MAKTPKKIGRPSKRTPEIDAEIVERLSNGEPLAMICRDDHMPGYRTVYDWKDDDAEFSANIGRARDLGEEVIAARTGLTARGQGDSTGDVQRDKLIIDTDLKLLAKFNPKRWGDKQLLGSDPENPLPQGFVVNLIKAGAREPEAG